MENIPPSALHSFRMQVLPHESWSDIHARLSAIDIFAETQNTTSPSTSAASAIALGIDPEFDTEDIWNERNTCYAHLMREIIPHPMHPQWSDLRYFQTADSCDQDAWFMAKEFVRRGNVTRLPGNAWVLREDLAEGLFVRGDDPVDLDLLGLGV